MGQKKVYICDCCGCEIDCHWTSWAVRKDHFYKIQGYKVYLDDTSYRFDDLIVCKECMDDIFKTITEKKNVNIEITVE